MKHDKIYKDPNLGIEETPTDQKLNGDKLNEFQTIPTFADTIPYMLHSNYKCRLIAEYWQTALRYVSLEKALESVENGFVKRISVTPLHILAFERDLLGWTLDALKERAKFEEVDLMAIFKYKQNNK